MTLSMFIHRSVVFKTKIVLMKCHLVKHQRSVKAFEKADNVKGQKRKIKYLSRNINDVQFIKPITTFSDVNKL